MPTNGCYTGCVLHVGKFEGYYFMRTKTAFQKLVQRFEGGANASDQLEKNTHVGANHTPPKQNFTQKALQKDKRMVARPLPVPPKPRRKSIKNRFLPVDLAHAIIENDLEMIRTVLKVQPELLHKVPLNKKIPARVKPLQQAILRAVKHLAEDNFEEAEKALQVIQLLVSQGADVNGPDEVGALPLDWGFANAKQVPLAITLLQLGANPNKVLNPLHRAVTFNSPELVKALIHAGVRVDAVDFATNKTALQQAVDQRCPKAYSVLKFYSAPTSYAVQHVNSKLFAHRFGLNGNITINNEAVELEGFTSQWTLNDISNSFETFVNSACQLTAFTPFKKVLHDTLAALQVANKTVFTSIPAQAKKRLKDIKKNPLKHHVFSLRLNTSTDSSHSVQVMIRGDMLYICNRGSGAGDKPGTIGYKITNPNSLNESIIRKLLEDDLSPEYIQNDLHILLGLQEKYYIPGEAQTVGNCSMASVQELVVALLFDNLLMNGIPPKKATAKASNIAKTFDISDKHDALENQLQYHLLLEPGSLEFNISATLLRKLFVKLDVEQPEQREMCQSIAKALIFDPQRAPSRQVSTTLQYISLGLDLLQSQFSDMVFNKKDQTKNKLKAANLSEISTNILNAKHYLTGKPNEVDLLKQHPTILNLNLHKAIQADDVEAVESLLKIASANRQKQSIDLLHLAVGYQCNKVLDWCIRNGEDINVAISEGQCKKLTPFAIAMLVNNKYAMRQLIKAGISTVNVENFAESPLALAVGLGSVSLVKRLLKITPNLQQHLPKLINLAQNHKQNQVLKLLQSQINLNDAVELTKSRTLLNQHKVLKTNRALTLNTVYGNTSRGMTRFPIGKRRLLSQER